MKFKVECIYLGDHGKCVCTFCDGFKHGETNMCIGKNKCGHFFKVCRGVIGEHQNTEVSNE